MSDKKVVRQLSIFINDREVINSMNGIGREITKVSREMRNLNKNSEDYYEKLKEKQDTLDALKEKQAEFKEEIHGTTEEMGAAAGAWGNLITGLRTGDLTMAATGMGAMKAAIIATTKAALAFIATPIGMAVTALAGIALATKEWLDYNNAAANANKTTAAITKLSGESLNEARVTAQSIAKTFDEDFNEVLETARVLVNEFGITYDEAFARIENGLIKGGAANGEFLESMREYPTFFAQAGYSVEEFQNMVNTGIDLGIYQDKLPDAIKEFALSVTEQTPAAREALENAFGTEFTTKLLAGVKDGSISVKDALSQVSDEAKRLGLNSQQAQQLTADLFRGAGEDAGGALKIFDAVSGSIENMKRPLTEVEQAVQDLADSERELAMAQDHALRSEGFEIWKNQALIALNSIQSAFYETVAFITNSREQLENIATAAMKNDIIKENSAAAVKEFEGYLEKLKKAAGKDFNLEEATKSYIDQMQISLKRAIKEKDQLEANSIRAEIKAIENAAAKKIEITNKNNIEDIKARTAANKKKLDELKRAQDQEQKELERFKEKTAKEAQAAMDAKVKEWIDGENSISALLKKAQQDRELDRMTAAEKEDEQIRNKWEAELEKYAEHTERLAELEAARDAELEAARIAREEEEASRKIERDLQSRERAAEIQAVIEEEGWAKMFADAEYLAEFELEEQRKRDLAKAEQAKASQEEIDAINRKYDAKRMKSGNQMVDFFIGLKQSEVKWSELTEGQKVAILKQGLNTAAEMFNKGSGAWKALKIAETTIATVQGAINAYQAMATIPVVGPALGAVAAAAVTATGMKAVKEIAGTKLEKQPKFFYGGFTGNKAVGYDEFGKITGAVHEDEYVVPKAMTTNPKYADTIAWLESERTGQSSSNAPAVSWDPTQDGGTAPDGVGSLLPVLQTTMERLIGLVENPPAPVLAVGYKDVQAMNKMSDEIKQSTKNGTMNQ